MSELIDTGTHYENEFMKVIHQKMTDIVFTSYKGYADDDVIHTGLMKAIEIAQSQKASNMIFDNTKFEGATPESQRWVKEKYFRLTYDAGIRNFAIVVPEHVFAVFSIDMAVNEDMIELLNIEKFSDVETAIEWVKKQ